MARTYRALALLLSYPTEETAALMPSAMQALAGDGIVPLALVRRLSPLAQDLAQDDLYEAQSRYVDLFDRTRSLSLQLYEHVHGESRDRGQAMVELLKLYSSHGLELTAKELPDHLPVFLEFLSKRPADEADRHVVPHVCGDDQDRLRPTTKEAVVAPGDLEPRDFEGELARIRGQGGEL